MQASRGVFTEHKVLPVGQGEGLFISAFHSSLNGCPQAGFNAVDQFGNGQIVLITAQAYLDLRSAALAVGRSHNTFRATEPL